MIKTFNVGVKGIIVKEGKALLLRARDGNDNLYWDLPGGRIDGTETIEETLEREIFEEVPSINSVVIGTLLTAYRLSYDLSDGNGLVLLYYRVSATFNEITLSNEHEDFRWINYEELASLNSQEIQIEEGYSRAVQLALSTDPM